MIVYYLDQNDKNWAAQERFCRRLGIPFSYAEEEGVDFHKNAAIFGLLIRKPWLVFRVFTVLNEYWTCRYYVDMIAREAKLLQTRENESLVESILHQVGLNLIFESPKDWSELMGLLSQKLVHLRYHLEIDDWEREGANFR